MLLGKKSARRARTTAAARSDAVARPTLPASRPLVAVLLGDGDHRFDRLVTWAADLTHDRDVDVFVQHGVTPLTGSLTGAARLLPEQLEDLLDRAWAVVSHGGATEILASRTHQHLPVVVPRLPELGEHGDDRQRASVARFADRGLCTAVSSRESLKFEVGSTLVARGLVSAPWTVREPATAATAPRGSTWLP